ncbi:MAG: TetR/AcrR family transcriptional regulator [Deltaproteobacteria bacterium]|nr:TetR/AcrR family transcriptional regulator [Deltaproteobacteria bacterium]
MPRYSSKQRQKDEAFRHRQEILETALKVFAEKGFSAATMQDVARAARFSVGKLYLHFPSKDALYRELLKMYVDELLGRVEKALAVQGSAPVRIAAAVHEELQYFEEHPMLLRLFVSETLGFELRLHAQFGQNIVAKYQRFQKGLTEVFAEGIAAGEFQGFSDTELTLKLSGILNAVITAEIHQPSGRNVGEMTSLVLRLFGESPLAEVAKSRPLKKRK